MSSTRPRQLKRTGTTARRLFERLTQDILRGELVGGQPLRESRLAREWAVSRTPLREALRRAAEAGFVVLRPNQAPVVRKLSGADVDAMYDLRALLETHALALAWDRIAADILKRMARRAAAARPDGAKDWRRRCLRFDRAFHQIWTRLSGNSWLEADLRRQHQFWSVFQGWVGRDEAALRKPYEEHIAILDAMRSGSKARAINALRNHILTSAEAVRKALQSHKRDDKHDRHT